MSDIRAQSRRDAEFERLLREELDEIDGFEFYNELDMCKAYEMGKRHGRDEVLLKKAISGEFIGVEE